ncbi:MXAN_6640 family putative metalloprotease [Nocardioides bigeumensis]|uniref:MXAN_6640 family putative metalloprotease n=1 Tax=Nocardioides bigeumensis TaxID=433657 RepID=UPI0031E331AA
MTRRARATAALVVMCVAGLMSAVPASGVPDRPAPGPGTTPAVLADARLALRGGDATLALTKLRLAYPTLSNAAREQADRLLARPTDGAADPNQFGWSVPEAPPVCSATFCVHYVPTGEDAPPPADADADGVPDQVTTTLATMESVLDHHTRVLGYRPPVPDGTLGGGPQFDVYLSQLGARGLYGFCAAENRAPGQRFVYSGYCVLDNDFVEFPLGPLPSLQVTAAHEFFHAIQFAYDAGEDGWFMESTATWVEERYGDDIDDNRQYLRHGQLGKPKVPLDLYDIGGEGQYGNWLFFERLSQRYGVDAVRRIWEQADATRGAPDRFSTAAVARVLGREGTSLSEFYADFAAGNQAPAAFYEEGASYRRSPVIRTVKLRKGSADLRERRRLDHLTSAAYRFETSSSLHGKWRLRIKVTGPPAAAGTAADVLLARKDGTASLVRLRIRANGTGARSVVVDSRLDSATLVLANASTRFKPCWRQTGYSCQGTPRDDGATFEFTASLRR